jgi:LPXTG-motif cell wall-anchored protein
VLSLPRTGFTIALLVGAGLLLIGMGLITRRVASAVERPA